MLSPERGWEFQRTVEWMYLWSIPSDRICLFTELELDLVKAEDSLLWLLGHNVNPCTTSKNKASFPRHCSEHNKSISKSRLQVVFFFFDCFCLFYIQRPNKIITKKNNLHLTNSTSPIAWSTQPQRACTVLPPSPFCPNPPPSETAGGPQGLDFFCWFGCSWITSLTSDTANWLI